MTDDSAARSTRRAFIGGLAVTGTVGLAGCSGLFGGNTLPTPVRGDPDADVTVGVFKDYACGHCAAYTLEQLPALESEYIEPGVIRYEQYDLPIPLSQESWRAPNAARAVQDTVGLDAYWEFSHALFANQDRLGLGLYEELASEVGADPETVRSAAADRKYDPTVKESRQHGVDLGVDATPTIVVNGKTLKSYGFNTIVQAIEAER
ncbi:Protein-disulfide isomerase [Halorhabdus sp. SVX81]|uniref:DsbA family protein n=1 Tax=Halorhabdus sp. SVX81 TaxID=2978283 RepID=UPI0023DBE194|nr:thioredoxin domain-containing protein [Halorhabdus sp. SVX81]WEL17471.1 Protein-disulfide isomerase [Halorhabdus sp. SVX81]